MDEIPHGRQFSEALTDKKFKSLLLDYISAALITLATSHIPHDSTLIIDSPTYGNVPMSVKNKTIKAFDNRKNSKGEADCGVYFNARSSQCKQIVINASDTDIYMYGMAL